MWEGDIRTLAILMTVSARMVLCFSYSARNNVSTAVKDCLHRYGSLPDVGGKCEPDQNRDIIEGFATMIEKDLEYRCQKAAGGKSVKCSC